MLHIAGQNPHERSHVMSAFDEEMFAKKIAGANLGYTLLEAQIVSKRLSLADADVKEAAIEWIEKGILSSLTVEGWSIERLETEFGMNYLAAILTIDWLRKDPQAALAAIRDGIK